MVNFVGGVNKNKSNENDDNNSSSTVKGHF